MINSVWLERKETHKSAADIQLMIDALKDIRGLKLITRFETGGYYQAHIVLQVEKYSVNLCLAAFFALSAQVVIFSGCFPWRFTLVLLLFYNITRITDFFH
jgi:hypothetical protein